MNTRGKVQAPQAALGGGGAAPPPAAKKKKVAPKFLDDDGKFKVGEWNPFKGVGPRSLAGRFLGPFSELDAKEQQFVASSMYPEVDEADATARLDSEAKLEAGNKDALIKNNSLLRRAIEVITEMDKEESDEDSDDGADEVEETRDTLRKAFKARSLAWGVFKPDTFAGLLTGAVPPPGKDDVASEEKLASYLATLLHDPASSLGPLSGTREGEATAAVRASNVARLKEALLMQSPKLEARADMTAAELKAALTKDGGKAVLMGALGRDAVDALMAFAAGEAKQVASSCGMLFSAEDARATVHRANEWTTKLPSSHQLPVQEYLCKVRQLAVKAVSYTHLTLPTIYSV